MHLVTSFVNGRVLHTAYPLQRGQPPESPVHLARRQVYEGFPEHTYKKQRSVGHLAILREKRRSRPRIVDNQLLRVPLHGTVVRVCFHACGVRAPF